VVGRGAILCVVALTWSLINFGILLWLPAELVAKGYSMGLASKLLAESAIIALPATLMAAALYSLWSTKGALAAMMAVSAAGLLGVIFIDAPFGGLGGGPVLPVALLVLGGNGTLAVLLPYTAELFPSRVRARAAGLVAGCTKFGGLMAQALAVLALIPALVIAAGVVLALLVLCVAMICVFGEETRDRDLRYLDGPSPSRSGATLAN
jgi:putative MFS transporter